MGCDVECGKETIYAVALYGIGPCGVRQPLWERAKCVREWVSNGSPRGCAADSASSSSGSNRPDSAAAPTEIVPIKPANHSIKQMNPLVTPWAVNMTAQLLRFKFNYINWLREG